MSELAGLADALGALAEDEENVTVLTDVDVVLLRSAATALRRAARVEAFVREWADEACEYGDGCPPFGSRHGRCRVCAASAALEADR